MKSRIWLAVALLASVPLTGSTAPAVTGGKSSGPPVVFQFATTEKLLSDVDKIVRIVGGEAVGDMVKDRIKNHLGEKGFAGLDLKKPIAGHLTMPNKPTNTPTDLKNMSGVLVIPITDEEEFKALVSRLFVSFPIEIKPVAGNKGLYSILPVDTVEDTPVRVRFHEGSAHIGINVKDEQLNLDALIPAA